ncbi:MAG TPA: sugar phosphate isomerase/epimerase family protein [Lacipirellulaceae bacterium]|nr:sugar phosphate isomerase/epimerase family protein [Lacipirellulaceae bacterium]
MPRLAAFPKAYMDELCVHGTMSIRQWVELAATLELEGLEFYTGFLELRDRAAWEESRRIAADNGLVIPMLCASPDFTHPDIEFRREQIKLQKTWIDMCAALGGAYCRVLSGQRRPELALDDGLQFAAECIQACLPHAAERGVILVLENHYKDNYWAQPEFAQKIDDFCALVAMIDSPHFGVNYDPSNAILAGDDPLELLRRIRGRVVTMHASDRYLAEGTLDDLRCEENSAGYAKRLRHGAIGHGLNDYDAIFRELSNVNFDGWMSIEDGINGIEELRESVAFLRAKMLQYWPE